MPIRIFHLAKFRLCTNVDFCLCSYIEKNDRCDAKTGLGVITDVKWRNQVDVFVASPCSMGEFCFVAASNCSDSHVDEVYVL